MSIAKIQLFSVLLQNKNETMLLKNVMVEEPLKNRLVRLVQENRISHALLFLASEGASSFALAIAFAQYLSCSNRGEHDSCGTCPSCVKYEKLSHPDLHLLFPNSTTTKIKKDPDSEQFYEDFRKFVLEKKFHISLADWMEILGGENKQPSINLRDTSNIINWNSTRSYEGGHKIYILWHADRLYHAAAPRLLKTLEEPENKSLFILITERADKILPTILSRTQLVKIGKPDPSLIAHKLMEDFGIKEQKAFDLATICDGNIQVAIDELTNEETGGALLTHFQPFWHSLCASALKKAPAEIGFTKASATIDEIVSAGREYHKKFVLYMLRMIRLMLMESPLRQPLMRASNKEKEFIVQHQGVLTVSKSTHVIEACNAALYHIERNGNTNLILHDLYFKIADALSGNKAK
ncbi:MAG: hypothetical protein LBV46_01915 [Bacteroidales bacterium]|jgi:DNA polymerase-3 subunit delta'|nr:hypothetical protein [Bacteroidales bacterium]